MALALIGAAADFLGRTGSTRTEDDILTLEGQAEEEKEVCPQTHKGTNHLRANTSNQILRRNRHLSSLLPSFWSLILYGAVRV